MPYMASNQKQKKMETTLLTLSALCFYYPLAMLHDTARRYDNMCKAGLDASYTTYNNLDPGYGVLVERGLPAGINPLLGNIFHYTLIIIAIFLPLLPLFKAFEWQWYYIILLHVLLSMVSHFLILWLQPGMNIYTVSQVKARAIISIIIGIILYIIPSYFL